MEQLKAFIEKAKTDSALLAKLNALGAKNAEAGEIIALAAEHGFAITAGEYAEAVKCGGNCARCGELNEQELDAVAGGGGSRHGDATQNRYDPNICTPSLGRTRYECVGFMNFIWCDHYYLEQIEYSASGLDPVYSHKCAKGAFNYIGYRYGDPG